MLTVSTTSTWGQTIVCMAAGAEPRQVPYAAAGVQTAGAKQSLNGVASLSCTLAEDAQADGARPALMHLPMQPDGEWQAPQRHTDHTDAAGDDDVTCATSDLDGEGDACDMEDAEQPLPHPGEPYTGNTDCSRQGRESCMSVSRVLVHTRHRACKT